MLEKLRWCPRPLKSWFSQHRSNPMQTRCRPRAKFYTDEGKRRALQRASELMHIYISYNPLYCRIFYYRIISIYIIFNSTVCMYMYLYIYFISCSSCIHYIYCSSLQKSCIILYHIVAYCIYSIQCSYCIFDPTLIPIPILSYPTHPSTPDLAISMYHIPNYLLIV